MESLCSSPLGVRAGVMAVLPCQVGEDLLTSVMEVFRNLEKREHPLSVRHKDILAPLNLEEEYKYCFGNRSIENSLKILNDVRLAKNQSIWKMTDAGSAIGVQEMMKRLKERHDQRTELRQQKLDKAAAEQHLNTQNEEEMSENQSDCIMPEIREEMPDSHLPQDIPPASEEMIRSVWSTLIGLDC